MWNTYIALGDSIVEGKGDHYPGYDNKGWVPLVGEKLKKFNPEMKYYNFGKCGGTTDSVLNTQVQKALKKKPDLITLTIGGNDTRESNWTPDLFYKKYLNLIKLLKLPDLTLITMTYPYLDYSGEELKERYGNNPKVAEWFKLHFKRIKDINQIIRETSKKHDLNYLEFEDYKPIKDPDNISKDMLHPNSRGYWYAANYVMELLQEKFKFPNLS